VTQLNLSRLHFPVTALGPGRRVGVWFQGCSLRCPGCVSADTWATGRGRTSLAAVLDTLSPWLGQADGVTITGGEPFEQEEALMALLSNLRALFDGDVLVYTGFERGDIEHVLANTEGLVDALIAGPYQRDAPQSLPLRGSDNQTLHLLTPLGRERFVAYQAPEDGERPAFDVMFDDGAVWFAGIPKQGDFARLSEVLSIAGHAVATSVDRSFLGRAGDGSGQAMSKRAREPSHRISVRRRI